LSPGIIFTVVPPGPYPSGVKTGELVHTSQRCGLVKIEGKFYDRTTTPECSEDRRAVPSVVKAESELYVCTQYVSTLHTHTFEGLQSWVTKSSSPVCQQ